MNVLLFGASGMVGQGTLGECLLDPRVDRVVSVTRAPSGRPDAKFGEILLQNLAAIDTVADRLHGFDACLFCVGVSAAGLSEPDYTRITYDLTLAAARTLLRLNPGMTFVYVSGAGTDSTERGRFMWARVKGRTENALLGLGFKAAYMVRPGAIQPLHGIRSRTGWYQSVYDVTAPIAPLLGRLFPGAVTTTEHVGRAMIHLADRGYAKSILETRDINQIG